MPAGMLLAMYLYALADPCLAETSFRKLSSFGEKLLRRQISLNESRRTVWFFVDRSSKMRIFACPVNVGAERSGWYTLKPFLLLC